MRVVSSLADIEFSVGRIARAGRDLVIESAPDSTIETRVTVTPRDARRTLGALFTSPAVWGFVLSLPFARAGRAARVGGDAWEARRRRTGLNKPW